MNDSPHTTYGYRFGPYETDQRSGELRKHGMKIKLQEQPFQVLIALLEHAGEMVTREDLQQRLWPTDTFVDFSHGLNAAIARLREALCDSAAAPRYIETVPRRGYRFLGNAETLGGEKISERRVMLAVLPFESLDVAPEQEFFADGMTEEMIAQLGRLNPAHLGVIARTSAMQYKRTTKAIDQIGQELNVDFVLEGSVRRAGQRVRITSQLIRAGDQSHLWAESYDRTLDDVLAIQADCAGRIAHALALELLPSQREAMSRASTRDAEAYEAFLQGRFYWNKRTEEGFRKAIGNFERSIAKDPEFALAYVGLADVYNLLGQFSMLPPKQAAECARAAADRALAIDPLLAEAHTSLAHGRFLYDWDWKGAEKEFLLGLQLNPNQVQGHYWFAFFLVAMRRFEEAFAHMQQALALDPVSLVVNTYFAWACYYSRDYDQAIVRFKKALELDVNFSIASIFLGLAYLQKGKWDEAVMSLQRGTDLTENHPGAAAALAAGHSLRGEREKGYEVLEHLKESSTDRYVSPYYRALALVTLGDQETALDWLERAFEERSGWIAYLAVDPCMDVLRSHPRFQKLLQTLAFPN